MDDLRKPGDGAIFALSEKGGAPELQLVVTSRERLAISLERVVEVGPFGLPEAGEDPPRCESGRLLLRRLLRTEPDHRRAQGAAAHPRAARRCFATDDRNY